MKPIAFTTEDLRTPESLERVLRQFQNALSPSGSTTVATPPLSSLVSQLAPLLRNQLQADGSAPLNLQSLLPAQANSTIIEDTHANRLTIYPAANYPVGTMFYETDRAVLYVVTIMTGVLAWTYLSGVMYATFASRPVDLGTNDAGFLLEVSDHLHLCRWTGNAWVILDNNAGIFVDSAVALGTGWQVCDGTATTYLAISGADLAQTAFTTPDEVTAPSGVYHKSIAAYTGTINAATAAGLTGSTANATATNNAAATGITVGAHSVVEITDIVGTDDWAFDTQADAGHTVTDPTHNHTQNAHAHAAGTLAVDATAQPRNMGVLRYFRR